MLTTVQQLKPKLPSIAGGLGLVVSCYNDVSSKNSKWHAVAMLRKGNTVRIFNPEHQLGR